MTKPKAAGTTRSERKRQSILDAATELFLRRGFPGTNMDDVATHAGVSKQTVYAQFESKEALFTAMVRSLTHAAGDKVQHAMEVLPKGTSLSEHLVAYAMRQLEVARTPQLMQLRRLVISEVERFPELGKSVYDHGPARAIAGLATAFSEWAERGLLRVPDAQLAAANFNWLIMGEPVNRAMLLGDAGVPSAAALRKHAQEAVRVFMAAYGPKSR